MVDIKVRSTTIGVARFKVDSGSTPINSAVQKVSNKIVARSNAEALELVAH